MQVSVVLLPKPSSHNHVIFSLLPHDHRLCVTIHLADQNCCLTFSNLSDRWQCIDEDRWLRCTTDNRLHQMHQPHVCIAFHWYTLHCNAYLTSENDSYNAQR